MRPCFALAVLLTLPVEVAARETPCDLLFTGGRLVDGTGAPWFVDDVCVVGDRIAAIGHLAGRAARRTIDASKLVVTPGFIDMLGQSEYNVLVDPRAASKVTQGITTEITGEGSIAPVNERMLVEAEEAWKRYGLRPSWTSFAGYFAAFSRARPAINLGTFVSAGVVRNFVIGENQRPATAQELAKMKAVVAQAMEQGALGLASALQYVPDRYASTEELIELAKVAAAYGGSYITHQRSEGQDINASLDEVFRIAREAHLPAQIYHLKVACKPQYGTMARVLRRIAEARATGLDVSANQYPYLAAENNLSANLPSWVLEGGPDKLVARLRDPAQRARIKADVQKPEANGEHNQYLCAGGAKGILLASVINPALKKYEGQTLDAIARAQGIDPIDALMDIVAADRGLSFAVIFIMDEADVRTALMSPLVSLGTDSPAMAEDGIFSQEKSHPRGWGSTARILGHYVRDEKLLPLEEAVRKMTSLPASRMGLADRGILRPGMAADLVVFDPATVKDRATFADPTHYSEGILFVAVNGQLVVDNGKLTTARPGRALLGAGAKRR